MLKHCGTRIYGATFLALEFLNQNGASEAKEIFSNDFSKHNYFIFNDAADEWTSWGKPKE